MLFASLTATNWERFFWVFLPYRFNIQSSPVQSSGREISFTPLFFILTERLLGCGCVKIWSLDVEYITFVFFPCFLNKWANDQSVWYTLQAVLLVGFQVGLWVAVTGRCFHSVTLGSVVSSLYCPCECRLMEQLIPDKHRKGSSLQF